MKEERTGNRADCGRFLNDNGNGSVRHKKVGRYLSVTLLLVWDGLLLYMIMRCLIEPVYGAAFVAVVSVYLGNKL